MKLSKECIEAIEGHEECYYQDYGANRNTKIRSTFMVGATEALTNPSIYSKAGLISLEDALGFAEWARLDGWNIGVNDTLWRHYMRPLSDKGITTAQLFQIYQEQKDK